MLQQESWHSSWVFVFAAILVGTQLSAQSSAPQTYSLTEISRMTEASMFTGQAATVKINRSDSKELVELTIALPVCLSQGGAYELPVRLRGRSALNPGGVALFHSLTTDFSHAGACDAF